MNDDLGKKVQQIAQVLNQEELPDNVKELVALLASSLGKKTDRGDGSPEVEVVEVGDSSQQNPYSDASNNEKSIIHDSDVNSDVLNVTRKAIGRFNSATDPRINLLQAIKPFMNNNRQNKISNCIQILQLAGLSRLLNEHEK